MPTIRHGDQLKIAAACFAGALINAALVPLALLLFAIVPPLGVILLAITAALAPVLLCTSIGFFLRWALLTRRAGFVTCTIRGPLCDRG